METNILTPHPIIWNTIPHFKHIDYNTDRGDYRFIEVSDEQLETIQSNFIRMDIEESTGQVIMGFTIEVEDIVVPDNKIVMYGKSSDWDEATNKELSTIITHNPIVTRGPIDKANNKIGNKLYISATVRSWYEYVVAILGYPNNIILFKI